MLSKVEPHLCDQLKGSFQVSEKVKFISCGEVSIPPLAGPSGLRSPSYTHFSDGEKLPFSPRLQAKAPPTPKHATGFGDRNSGTCPGRLERLPEEDTVVPAPELIPAAGRVETRVTQTRPPWAADSSPSPGPARSLTSLPFLRSPVPQPSRLCALTGFSSPAPSHRRGPLPRPPPTGGAPSSS